MSCPNKDQIGKIEQELEKAEHEFRRAAEVKSFSGMMQMHNRLCQLVAALSAAYSGEAPTVFAKYHVPGQFAPEPAAAVEPPPPPALPGKAGQPAGQAQEPPETAALSSQPDRPAPGVAPEKTDELPDIAELEKQLAELAARMQKCLEAGDMDGMLKASEGMANLSELMTKAEARNKEKNKEARAQEKPAEPATSEAKTGSWAPGDTMALARQRAEERKKTQKISDSLDLIVSSPADQAGQPGQPAEIEPSSAVDLLFNDKMRQRLSTSQQMKSVRDTGSRPRPKIPLTPEQLREKLDSYNFYQILSVHSTASFEELHKSFFKKIRRLNKKLSDNSLEIWQFQEFVAALCLAHDVLRFPNARLQYDMIIFGQDGNTTAEVAARSKLMPLREMLKFSTLINSGELSDALEKHKSNKNERDVGYYLVEKGLLSNEELDSILFAQKLVSVGKLTVAQFELAMQEMRENSIPLLDTLVASEWIRPQDVFSGELL